MLIKPQSPGFILLLGVLAALPPLSIDMSLPALSEVTGALGISPSLAGLTLTLFMVGFCATPVVYGPLSDRYGRKPILLAGLTLFTLGGIGAALAPSIHILLGARLVQGAGAGAGTSMAFAIVRDLFEAHEARKRLSYVTIVMTVAPMVAPSIGALVLEVGNWRAIYATLAASGFLVLLAVTVGLSETAHRRTRQGSLLGGVIRGYGLLFGNRVSLGFTLVFGFCFGVQFSYISGSPLVLLGLYGVSPRIYGLLFAATALGITAGAFVNGRLNAHKIPPLKPLIGGFCLLVGSGLVLVLLTATGRASVPSLMPFLVLSSFAYGLLMPNVSHGAMEPIPEIAGIAGGMLTTFQMGTGAVVSALVAFLYAGFGLYAMTAMMLLCGLLAAITYLAIVRPMARAHRSS
jgi:DHA1 family bicyclomycin/chloramphenicol resistance-like MFS transporter